MKHILITTLFLTAAIVSAYAQPSLRYRKLIKDVGVSMMSEDVQVEEKGQLPLNLSLMYETVMQEDEDRDGFSLIFTCLVPRNDWYIPADGKLLIRTSTGTVLSLSQITPGAMKLYNPANGLDSDRLLKNKFNHQDNYSGAQYYQVFGKYPISEDDLKVIIKEGIIKIRIETTGNFVECEYPAQEEIRIDRRRKEQHNICSYFISHLYDLVSENINPYTTF